MESMLSSAGFSPAACTIILLLLAQWYTLHRRVAVLEHTHNACPYATVKVDTHG